MKLTLIPSNQTHQITMVMAHNYKKIVFFFVLVAVLFFGSYSFSLHDNTPLVSPTASVFAQGSASSATVPLPNQETTGVFNKETGRFESSCSKFTSPLTCGLSNALNQFLEIVALLPIYITGLVLYIAGVLLNIAVLETVVLFAGNFNSVAGISIVWETLRDLANIFFIFGLLVIAISMILGLQSYGNKKLVATLIVVALVINFSFLFTKVVIDVSNMFALQFYNAITPSQASTVLGVTTGISDTFMQSLGITGLWENSNILDQLNKINFAKEGGIGLMFLYSIFTSVFFLITAFVFFFAAIMLIVRGVGFMLLAMLSPLAFAALVLPQTAGMAKEWWEKLWQYAVFAPILMVLFWVVASVGPGITESFGAVQGAGIGDVLGTNPANRSQGVAMILNFIILTTLILASVMIANKLSLKGAQGLGNYGKKIGIGLAQKTAKGGGRLIGKTTFGTTAAVSRNTVGLAADTFANSDFAKRLELGSPRLGGAFVRGAQKVAGSSLDARGLLPEKAQEYTGTGSQTSFVENKRKLGERRLQQAERVEGLGETPEQKADLRKVHAKNMKSSGLMRVVSPTIYSANKTAAETSEKIADINLAAEELKEVGKDLNKIKSDINKKKNELQGAPKVAQNSIRADLAAMEDQRERLENRREELKEKKEGADKVKNAFKKKEENK